MRVFSNCIFNDFVMCVQMDNTNWTMYLRNKIDGNVWCVDAITSWRHHIDNKSHTHMYKGKKSHPETHTEQKRVDERVRMRNLSSHTFLAAVLKLHRNCWHFAINYFFIDMTDTCHSCQCDTWSLLHTFTSISKAGFRFHILEMWINFSKLVRDLK